MPPKTQRTLLEDEQKRVKANAALLRGDDSGVERGLPNHLAPAARATDNRPPQTAQNQDMIDRLSGASPEDAQKVRRNLLDAAGGPQSDENWHVVPGSAGFSMRSKHFDPATKALFAPKSVQEAIDPRGRTEILQAGDIDFTGTRTALNGSGVRSIRDSRAEHGVSAEDALAILRGNQSAQAPAVFEKTRRQDALLANAIGGNGTGIPALPDDIAQRRSDFAEESAAAIGGGSREDRAKRLTEIRRPAVEAAAKIEADATAAQKVKDEIAIKSAAASVTAFSQELRTQWEIKGRGEISDAELADKVAERERAIVVQREDDKRKGLYVDSPEYETKMAAEVTNELLVQESKNEARLEEIGLQGKNAKETVQLELAAKKEADRLQGKNVDSEQYKTNALSELNAKLDVDIAKAKLDNNSEAIARLESTKNQVILDRVNIILESGIKDSVKLEKIEKLQAQITSVNAEPAEVPAPEDESFAFAPFPEGTLVNRGAAVPAAEAPAAEAPVADTSLDGGTGSDYNGDGDISAEEQQYNDASRIRNNKEQYEALTPAEQLRLNQRLSELKPIVIGN
tara:strand:+ start:2323 stop:4032 length:1710 start_codon:yes stop_codon:yes gene_type:complete